MNLHINSLRKLNAFGADVCCRLFVQSHTMYSTGCYSIIYRIYRDAFEFIYCIFVLLDAQRNINCMRKAYGRCHRIPFSACRSLVRLCMDAYLHGQFGSALLASGKIFRCKQFMALVLQPFSITFMCVCGLGCLRVYHLLFGQ